MRMTRHVLWAGVFALALGASGISVSFAWDNDNHPALPSDASPTPVPPFLLPSDTPPAQGNDQLFMFRTDPTGQLVPNLANPDIPTEKTNLTNDQFLTYSTSGLKRIDTTDSACAYYKALNAITHVTSCGTNGALQNDGSTPIITFEQWKHDVGIDNYGPPGKTDVAHFINQVDLNLTRDHHMISYSADQLASYVCNHTGPTRTGVDPSGLFPTQREINGLIRSIKSNTNLIACVAMEYSNRGQASGTPPFIKFLIFGTNGNLLSTVDLDGRGPKGVPHVCTACHGGPFKNEITHTDPATGVKTLQFDPASNGDLGAHFLPFDKANFAFSSRSTAVEQDEAIFKLNLDVYITEASRIKFNPDTTITFDTLASASITDLISKWYNSKVTRDNPAPSFNPHIEVPVQWDFLGFNDIYLNSYAHSCRTCHVAMDTAPLEREPSLISPLNLSNVNSGGYLVCKSHVMPNAKVTFDRFWLSDPFWNFPQMVPVPGQPAASPNQPELLSGMTHCASLD